MCDTWKQKKGIRVRLLLNLSRAQKWDGNIMWAFPLLEQKRALNFVNASLEYDAANMFAVLFFIFIFGKSHPVDIFECTGINKIGVEKREFRQRFFVNFMSIIGSTLRYNVVHMHLTHHPISSLYAFTRSAPKLYRGLPPSYSHNPEYNSCANLYRKTPYSRPRLGTASPYTISDGHIAVAIIILVIYRN